VEPDRINLTMNVHSYRQPEGDTPEADAERQRLYEEQDVTYGRTNGVPRYCQGGIHKGREDYFYFASLLGINRAIDWLAGRPECDLSSFGYSGTSQGGGFGLMLAALNRHFTRSCIFVPAITDLLGSKIEERQSGWPGIIENQAPENKAAAERWAPYYDGANFARLIQCPIRFVVGFCDMACPPHAVYSAYNVCASRDKGIVHGIGMGHGVFERFYHELDDWLRQ
jgi:cephalosporin-C deacetylase-like acetyl esterase